MHIIIRKIYHYISKLEKVILKSDYLLRLVLIDIYPLYTA